MADKANSRKGRDLVNIQIDRDVHRMLTIIQERYRTRRLSDGIRQFVQDHDPEIATVAQTTVKAESDVANKTDSPKE